MYIIAIRYILYCQFCPLTDKSNLLQFWRRHNKNYYTKNYFCTQKNIFIYLKDKFVTRQTNFVPKTIFFPKKLFSHKKLFFSHKKLIYDSNKKLIYDSNKKLLYKNNLHPKKKYAPPPKKNRLRFGHGASGRTCSQVRNSSVRISSSWIALLS